MYGKLYWHLTAHLALFDKHAVSLVVYKWYERQSPEQHLTVVAQSLISLFIALLLHRQVSFPDTCKILVKRAYRVDLRSQACTHRQVQFIVYNDFSHVDTAKPLTTYCAFKSPKEETSRTITWMRYWIRRISLSWKGQFCSFEATLAPRGAQRRYMSIYMYLDSPIRQDRL